jgi:pyrroline-5-carboxylate reductase
MVRLKPAYNIAAIGGRGKMAAAVLNFAHRISSHWKTILSTPSLNKGPSEMIVKSGDVDLTYAVAKSNFDAIKALRGASNAMVFLALKPQQLDKAAPEIREGMQLLGDDVFLVSILAGTLMKTLSDKTGCRAVVRCMPNMPIGDGWGITYCVANEYVTDEQRALTTKLLNGASIVRWLKNEWELHAYTAVAGSGPAYVFWCMSVWVEVAEAIGMSHQDALYTVINQSLKTIERVNAEFEVNGEVDWQAMRGTLNIIHGENSAPMYMLHFIEAMVLAAQAANIPAKAAHEAAIKMILGAVHSVNIRFKAQGDVDLINMRQNITSPGGTTEAALCVLMQADLNRLTSVELRELVCATVQAGCERSIALSRLGETLAKKPETLCFPLSRAPNLMLMPPCREAQAPDASNIARFGF